MLLLKRTSGSGRKLGEARWLLARDVDVEQGKAVPITTTLPATELQWRESHSDAGRGTCRATKRLVP